MKPSCHTSLIIFLMNMTRSELKDSEVCSFVLILYLHSGALEETILRGRPKRNPERSRTCRLIQICAVLYHRYILMLILGLYQFHICPRVQPGEMIMESDCSTGSTSSSRRDRFQPYPAHRLPQDNHSTYHFAQQELSSQLTYHQYQPVPRQPWISSAQTSNL